MSDSATNFPWKTSVMIFIFNETGQVLLNQVSGYWGAFLFPTSQGVDIREMTIDLINEALGRLYTKDQLAFLGVIEKLNTPWFIYSLRITDQPVPNTTIPAWFSTDDLPHCTYRLDQDLLSKILKCESIGVAPAS